MLNDDVVSIAGVLILVAQHYGKDIKIACDKVCCDVNIDQIRKKFNDRYLQAFFTNIPEDEKN